MGGKTLLLQNHCSEQRRLRWLCHYVVSLFVAETKALLAMSLLALSNKIPSVRKIQEDNFDQRDRKIVHRGLVESFCLSRCGSMGT